MIDPEMISLPPQVGEESVNRYLTGIARIPSEDGASETLVLCLDTTKVLLRDEVDELIRN